MHKSGISQAKLPWDISISTKSKKSSQKNTSSKFKLPARSTLSVSQTLTLKSSYPAMSSRPDLLKATEVTPQMMLSCAYWASSWSALMSYSFTVASSEPVQKAVPCGKNCKAQKNRLKSEKKAHLLARRGRCPTRCSCGRRSQRLIIGPTGKRPPKWCRKWCCRGCTPTTPGRCGCRTDDTKRRQNQKQRRNRSEKTK